MTNPFVKIRTFSSEVVVELKKSSWPTRPELVGSTVVVIVTMLVLGVFVALADVVLVKVVGLLLRSN
jgi:preprotein translocase subunit SecE